MHRRSIFIFGLSLALLGLAVGGWPTTCWAADPPAPTHENPAVHAEAEHETGSAENPNPLEPQPALAIWSLVVFVVLLLVLRRFAWKPLIEALHQREEHLEHTLLQTEKVRNESEQLLAEHRRLMAQADERVKSIFDKAQKDAQASGEEIVKAAKAEAEAARDRAQREISTARDQALAEIWSQTANLAVSVAGSVLSKQLDEDDHRRLLDLAIKELPAAPVSTNGHGGSHA